jgi:hypothetical protein
MKGFFLTFALFLCLSAICQNDTLYEENMRKVADIVFKELTPNLYGNTFINRSFSSNEVTLRQLRGDYSQKHSIIQYFNLYEDLVLSKIDSTEIMNLNDFTNFIFEEFEKNEKSSREDILIQPFGFLLQNVSYIDSSKLNMDNFTRSGFSFVPITNEENLYEKKILKSGALIEFYPESGYRTGFLKYTPEIINVSDDISNLELKIDVGNGFLPFNNDKNKLIEYNRTSDSLIGKLAFSYVLNEIEYFDTLEFYLTTKGESAEKSYLYWEFVSTFHNSTHVDFDIGSIRGCDNNTFGPVYAKRPVIIVPPYRPSIQPFSMQKYFDQFNVDDYFNKLVNKGYDIYFIKLKPGNASLETSAQALIEYLTMLNENKHEGYPREDWENILMGYSMGGQIARYALKKMEKFHMDYGTPHHHTRLYIPFDSPHLGANIPMFTQFVYKELSGSNLFAAGAYNSLVDEASKDMSITHVNGLYLSSISGNAFTYDPGITEEREDFVNALDEDFNHIFTPLDDMRKTFPSFTRNIAVSTGSNSQDYNQLYDLTPGMLLFNQNAIGSGIGGFYSRLRRIYASKYTANQPAFRIKDKIIIIILPVVTRDREFRMNYGLEFDLAQGGYKDEFYNANVTGATNILRMGAFGLGQSHYNEHMSFLPLVSALAINPSIWQNNNIRYDLKERGLMYNQFNFNPETDKSEFFGYPNLANPDGHFIVTPFEAVYADPQTYEHIKLAASIEDNQGYDPTFLESTTQFLLDEIEANDVYLQNKVIGDNHVQWMSDYRYKAWYKAKNILTIGEKVTPKTDEGAYIIKASGDITVYAGDAISIKPGFHTQAGSSFLAYIHNDEEDCSFSGMAPNQSESEKLKVDGNYLDAETEKNQLKEKLNLSRDLQVFPNPSDGNITILFPYDIFGEYEIVNSLGRVVFKNEIPKEQKVQVQLDKGIYVLKFQNSSLIKKIMIL